MDGQANFSVERTIRGKKYSISFTRILLPGTIKYFIAASNGNNIIEHVEMQSNHRHKWKLVQPAPEMFAAIETDLARIIEEQEHNHYR